ncbi:MAG: 4,5-DOPA-extradiol-dioxygenase [Caldimonas sp.]
MIKRGADPDRGRRRVVLSLGAAGGLGATGALADEIKRTVGALPQPAGGDARPALRGRAPSLFVGHGSPMNALEDNRFTRTLRRWGEALGLPRAIVVVSAHWLTPGSTQVSAARQPETIHDFGGFPAALQAMTYPAPGAPGLARATAARLGPRPSAVDPQRGLDHGAWTVLHHLYPDANVPVYQVSIDYAQAAPAHLALGRALAGLRDEGVLVLGSGNIVHNLGATERGAGETTTASTAWAGDFDERVKRALDAGDHAALVAWDRLGAGARMAVPTPDHYFPLLYALGAVRPDEAPRHVFEGFHSGTLSMRCLQWG